MKHFSYPFVLINDNTNAKIWNPTENDYDCDFSWYWYLAKWIYLLLVVCNFITFICGSCIWHTIGITMGIQMLTYIPLLKNYPPSCLSHFMVDMQVSLGKHIIPWPPLGLLFGITENWNDGSTNYRFQRGNILNHNFLINGGEMICIVACAWATIPLVAFVRLIFYKN